jgi:DNA polymerase-3 subunit epsilon
MRCKFHCGIIKMLILNDSNCNFFGCQMTALSLIELKNHPDHRILKRVSEQFERRPNQDSKLFTATIIDLETMGMNAWANEIIEIGMLSFVFSTGDGIVGVIDTYNELNDPGKPIPAEITQVTKITDADVEGKSIDWGIVSRILKQSHLVICHNSGFDRKFLELQTPEDIRTIVESRPFACTVSDISWKGRGYESSKLDYLNFKMGYFYEGHRALVDCWATFNLFRHEPESFDELKANVRRKETLVCAANAPFDKKDLLKARKYRWEDGLGSLPKCWRITIANDLLEAEQSWLDKEIYGREGASRSLPMLEVSAFVRYSHRAELME